jgi:hypothetical protein
MLNKAEVTETDQWYIATYNIQIIESDGSSRLSNTVLGIVPKGPEFDREENDRRQSNRIPVTVFK